MHTSEILPGVHYAGVNDRSTTRFEGLWPLPYGVSYNAYVVSGEKTALIDTVEASYAEEYISYIRSIVSAGSVDYLVVNHMEPDHSGSILHMVREFPNLKIVGNKQTISMIQGFYGPLPDSLFFQVADGDEIDLGGLTLRFYLTPMVHWPETMMTHLVERNLVFSGDAFGTFGAVNGSPLDDDKDISLYISEMYRYYSNIVGKYGVPVQRALAKVGPLSPEMVCPTHGLVWHKHLQDVVGLVDRLSRQEPEDGATIIYGSMYGNTARMADMMADALARQGVRNICMHNAVSAELSDMISDAWRYSRLVVAAPTYSMAVFPPVSAFMEAMKVRELKNRRVALIGEYTWAPAAAKIMTQWAEDLGLEIAGTISVKQAPSSETLSEIDSLAKALK